MKKGSFEQVKRSIDIPKSAKIPAFKMFQCRSLESSVYFSFKYGTTGSGSPIKQTHGYVAVASLCEEIHDTPSLPGGETSHNTCSIPSTFYRR